MSFTKLFVGALPFVYADEELRALFAGVGRVVSAKMVFDPDRNRTRGFGFVEMSTPEEAQAAIDQLNGRPIGEKNIFVTEAREKPAANPNKTPKGDRFHQVKFRKAGRNDRQPKAVVGESTDFYTPRPERPRPYKAPARMPEAFKRFAKRDFRDPETSREGFGSRDRGPRPMSSYVRGGKFADRPTRTWQDRPRRDAAGKPFSQDRPRSGSARPFRSRDERGPRTEPARFDRPRFDRGPRPENRPTTGPKPWPERPKSAYGGSRRPPERRAKLSKQDYWMNPKKKNS